MRIEIAVRTLAVEVGQGRVVRAGAGDHYVVDLLRQALEEPVEGGRVGRVEGRGAQCAEFGRGALQALGIAARQDDVGALGACSPGGLEPDAGTAADHDDGLPVQFRLTLDGKGSGCGGHNSSGGWCGQRASLPQRVWAGHYRRILAPAGQYVMLKLHVCAATWYR